MAGLKLMIKTYTYFFIKAILSEEEAQPRQKNNGSNFQIKNKSLQLKYEQNGDQ